MKKYLIAGLAIIILLGSLFVPKLLSKKEDTVSYKIVAEEEIPDKVSEVLPKYLMEERALTCKYKDDIFVIVTRGEKNTKGYFVEIDKLVQQKSSEEGYELTVYAKYTDPNPDEIVQQEYDYPFVVVKTNLKNMPTKVHLDIKYNE